jgi:hypothetical protein
MKEARRAPGSEWLKDHPNFLVGLYHFSKRLFERTYPVMVRINPSWAGRSIVWAEELFKGWMFNCQMCGQCILHSTGMTCPMTCPKHLRNGPCGGVRANGHCEVIPERPCVWVQAWERSRHMKEYADELLILQPPVNHALQGTSAWINMIEERDIQIPSGWGPEEHDSSGRTTARIS